MEKLKLMHKQASINIRQAPSMKGTFRRRAVGVGNSTSDPLDQYKPSVIGANNTSKIALGILDPPSQVMRP